MARWAGGWLAVALTLPSPVFAQGAMAPALPGIGAHDPRRPVDAAQAPWSALGRVQTELGGRCTGTLVAPDRVLTAAHCLVARRTGRLVQPGSVHVLLGYHLGAWRAHGRVVGFTVGPGYTAGVGPVGADWAVLHLAAPMDQAQPVLPLLREPPAPGSPLMLGGYQQDRPEVLMADTGCRAIGLRRAASGHVLLLHGCAGTRGASGAPVLAPAPGGGWGVAGVAVAVAAGQAVGQAVPASAIGGLP